ncbi:MAG: hypothetical protein K0S08_627 [Gammaproteobacteria bacterium]|jgi:hypothetical protein|nr:hypothetical protein [Gammaproteobacteria bacterium]
MRLYSEEHLLIPPPKNAKYNWKALLPGWATVAAAAVIVSTKHILDTFDDPKLEIVKTVLNAAYPGAFSHLAGISLGVGVDVVAVIKNGPAYFKEGHNKYHIDLLPNESPAVAWGLAWGIHASWKLSAMFAAVETIPCIVFAALGQALPFTYLGYGLLGLTGIGIAGAHIYSNWKFNNYLKSYFDWGRPEPAQIPQEAARLLSEIEINPAENCDQVDLKRIPASEASGWFKTGFATGFTYFFGPVIAAPATVISTVVAGSLYLKGYIPGLK